MYYDSGMEWVLRLVSARADVTAALLAVDRARFFYLGMAHVHSRYSVLRET